MSCPHPTPLYEHIIKKYVQFFYESINDADHIEYECVCSSSSVNEPADLPYCTLNTVYH